MKRAWIRVDANGTIGRGHLSRCLALADMLKGHFRVIFLIKEVNRIFCSPLLEEWEAEWIESDEKIISLVAKIDLLITDSYEIDNFWRLKYQKLVKALIDINDTPGEVLGADLIINHSPGIRSKYYSTSPNTRFLLGLDYAILRPAFLTYARSNQEISIGEGVFVCFGGADPLNLGVKVVEGLLAKEFNHSIYLITAKSNDRVAKIASYPNVQVLSNLSAKEMRDYMQMSRLMLLSASILSFEAIALRKPTLVTFFVDNQKLVYEGLVGKGLVKGVREIKNQRGLMKYIDTAISLFNSEELLEQLGLNTTFGIDGNSGLRISRQLQSL